MTDQNYENQNNETQLDSKKKNSKKWLLILTAIIGVILVVCLLIVSNPKVKLRLVMKSIPKQVRNLFETDNNFDKLFSTQSSSTISEIDLSDLLENLEVDLLTAYQNETGDGLIELSTGAGQVGIYLTGDELAFASTLSDIAFAIDTQNDFDSSKNTNLIDRLSTFSMDYEQDEQLLEYTEGLDAKLRAYIAVAMKELPKGALSKGKDKIEILGTDKNTKYIELSLDSDDLKNILKIILEEAEADDEFHELIKGISENNMYFETEDTDIEEAIGDMIEESIGDMIDALDDIYIYDLNVKVYYKGFKFLGIEIEYDDYDDTEIMVVMDSNKSSKSFEVTIDSYDKFEMKYNKDTNSTVFELETEYMKADFEISGNSEEKDIEGEIVAYDYTILSVDGTYKKQKKETVTEIEIEIPDIDMKSEIKCTLNEIRKNKEYEVKTNLIFDLYGDEIEINIDQTILFGDIEELTLGSWTQEQTYTYSEIINGDIDIEDDFFDIFSSLFSIFE